MKLLLPSLLALSGAVQAQEVTLLGKVEDVSGTSNQFFVDCTDTALTSSTFDLNAFVSAQVQITGQWNGSISSPSVEVEAIAVVPETFEIGGGAKIGDDSHFGFTSDPGTTAVGFLSTGPSFLPIDGTGVLFVDPGGIVLVDAGTIGGSGNLELEFFIPNNPALIGFDIYGQGALLSGGTTTLTNPDCKEIDD